MIISYNPGVREIIDPTDERTNMIRIGVKIFKKGIAKVDRDMDNIAFSKTAD